MAVNIENPEDKKVTAIDIKLNITKSLYNSLEKAELLDYMCKRIADQINNNRLPKDYKEVMPDRLVYFIDDDKFKIIKVEWNGKTYE